MTKNTKTTTAKKQTNKPTVIIQSRDRLERKEPRVRETLRELLLASK